MNNFKTNKISTVLGLILFAAGIVLIFMYLFIDLKREISLWQIGLLIYTGVIFAISEDKAIDMVKTFFTAGINKLFGKVEK